MKSWYLKNEIPVNNIEMIKSSLNNHELENKILSKLPGNDNCLKAAPKTWERLSFY